MKTLWTEWQHKCQGTILSELERAWAGRDTTFQDRCLHTFGLQTFYTFEIKDLFKPDSAVPAPVTHQHQQPAIKAQVLQARHPSSLGFSWPLFPGCF